MLYALLAGMAFGLSAGVWPGPLLTLIITQTLKHGAKEGIKVALAPLLTDLPIVVGAFLLVGGISSFQTLLGLLSLAGGIYLLFLTWEHFQVVPPELNLEEQAPHSWRKGMLVNFLNPHPYLFWITVGAPLVRKVHAEQFLAAVAFMVGFYSLLVGTKVVLAYLLGSYHGVLQGKTYTWILRGMGAILMVFAVLLFMDAWRFFTQ